MRVLLVPSADIAPLNSLEGTWTLLRCQKALELLETGEYGLLVLSGGICQPPEFQTQPAAEIMADWFRAQGVDSTLIVAEGESRDTYENIFCSLHALQIPRDLLELSVVSNWQHTLRFAVTGWRACKIRIKRIPLHHPVPVSYWFMEWGLLAYHVYDRSGSKRIACRNRLKRTFDGGVPDGRLRRRFDRLMPA